MAQHAHFTMPRAPSAEARFNLNFVRADHPGVIGLSRDV